MHRFRLNNRLLLLCLVIFSPVFFGFTGCESTKFSPQGTYYLEGGDTLFLKTLYRSETVTVADIAPPAYWPAVQSLNAESEISIRKETDEEDNAIVIVEQGDSEIARIALNENGKGSAPLSYENEQVASGCFLVHSSSLTIQFDQSGDTFELAHTERWLYDSALTENVICPEYLEDYASQLEQLGSPENYPNPRDRLFVSSGALNLERMRELDILEVQHRYAGSRLSD